MLCLLERHFEERPCSQLIQPGWDMDENTHGLCHVLSTETASVRPLLPTSLPSAVPAFHEAI